MQGTVITKKGIQLLVKLMATKNTLKFTRASIGVGKILKGYDPASMNDLVEYKMDALIAKCIADGDTAKITMQISSNGIETGFILTEAGIFAEDPDIGEILYAYIDLNEDPQYIYAEGGQTVKFVEITLDVAIETNTKVTAVISPTSMITRAEYDEKIKKIDNDIKATNRNRYVTIPLSGWGEEAPYIQIVNVEGLRDTDTPITGFQYPHNIDEIKKKNIDKSIGMITRLKSGNGTIEIECKFRKPLEDIQMVLKGVSG